LAPVKVTSVLDPTATVPGEKVTVVPAGLPVALSATFPVKPPLEAVPSVIVIVDGAGQAAVAGVVGLNRNPNGGGAIVMSTLLISKKILSIASTIIRTVELGVLGTVIDSVPSLGVLAISVVKLVPPFVEIEIRTLAQLTGAPVVPFTDQVIVSVLPAVQLVAVFWEVIKKGPRLATVTTISSDLVLPPPERLSLAIKRKFMVLATPGSTSQRWLFDPSNMY
jgi:hypothetical protein